MSWFPKPAGTRTCARKPPSDDWDLVRRAVYRQAGNRCEVCGGRGPRHPVECHEVWVYDDQRHVQRLERMIALCPACHECKHMGHANVTGHGARARRHLAQVNGWSASQVERYVEARVRGLAAAQRARMAAGHLRAGRLRRRARRPRVRCCGRPHNPPAQRTGSDPSTTRRWRDRLTRGDTAPGARRQREG